jgi:methionine aminopeptidase
VLDIAAAALRPGITGDELDRIVYDATIARKCYPSPLNYNGALPRRGAGGRDRRAAGGASITQAYSLVFTTAGFPKSFCVSVNEVRLRDASGALRSPPAQLHARRMVSLA